LKTKSEELAKILGHDTFKATDAWLSRWKVRNNIKFKKAQGDQAVVQMKVPSSDIYNSDESGLYYRATPDGSLCYKHIALSGYEKAMGRIPVL